MGADPLSAPPPPPGFRLDGVASPAPRKRRKDELPQPPEGFSLDEPAPSPSLGNDSIVAPRDGDTLRLQSGRNLRLYGVDAPELKQQGWNRQGQTVPIGRQSLQALTDTVAKAAASIGTPVGQSYGRPVAPVTVGGNDLGLTLARQGDAMAAPRYLGNDPARRHDYMQAERLARLNGLGIHDTMFQPPEQYRKRQRDDAATLLVASIMGNLASKTWLSGVSDLVSALHEPDLNAGNLMQRLAGSIAVPAGVAQVARVVDPVGREADTMGDTVKARIPYASRSLPAKRDVWGKPVRNEGGLGPDMLSPLWVTTAKDDVVNRQLLASGASIGKVPAKIAGQQLTPAQHSRYQVEAGQRSYTALRGLVTSPKWKTLDAESRQAEVAKVTRKARESARAVLFGPGRLGEVPNAPLKKVVPPPPRGFTMEGDAGGRNVFSDLKRAVPGVRFTSGFRTPEYQADMRRRGYKPASNSGHLDGSALDMLPPAGKTLAWLRERVRRFDPNARLLVHDGHLHATFPGYYGAPVLGGAKGAGLKNPNAGMPPPPAGFTLDGR